MIKCKRDACEKITKTKKENKKTFPADFCSSTCAKLHFIEMKCLTEEKLSWGFDLFIYTNDKK